MARNESPDRRPLLYGFAAVLILVAAGFIFWPRGNRSEGPGMILTPETEQGQLAGQIETPSEELATALDPNPAGTGAEVAPEEIQAQPIAETEYAVETNASRENSTTNSPSTAEATSPVTDRAVSSSPPTQPAPRASDLSQPGPTGRYLLYLGSFSTRANAGRKATELQGKGVPAEIASGSKADGSPIFRVRVGYFQGHSRAKSYGEGLKTRLGLDYWIAER
jgi:cell division septation protein DedD